MSGKNPRRIDAKPRALDGGANFSKVKNRDPDRDYVLVYQGTPHDEYGVGYYEGLGYEVEKHAEGPDAVALAGGKTTRGVGDPITFRGHVLMSCSKADKEQRVRWGDDGDTGQQSVDALEKKIVSKKGWDPMRGLHSQYMTGEKEIDPLRAEVAAE